MAEDRAAVRVSTYSPTYFVAPDIQRLVQSAQSRAIASACTDPNCTDPACVARREHAGAAPAAAAAGAPGRANGAAPEAAPARNAERRATLQQLVASLAPRAADKDKAALSQDLAVEVSPSSHIVSFPVPQTCSAQSW